MRKSHDLGFHYKQGPITISLDRWINLSIQVLSIYLLSKFEYQFRQKFIQKFIQEIYPSIYLSSLGTNCKHIYPKVFGWIDLS
jgi:hypothetical protein